MLDAIGATVRTYVEGMCGADPERLRRAFHPKAHITGTMQGEFVWLPLETFVSICAGHGPEPGAPVWRITASEVAGDTAVVRVEDVYQGLRFTDLLTLAHFPEGWRIIHKAFWVEGPA